MKPPPFAYEAPTQLADAISLLADPDREAMVLAGGQSLLPMLNLRFARPELLVDLRRIEGLDHIRLDGDRLVIGAMATKRAVERSALVKEHHPLLHASTLEVGHPQIRNRGTVGGSMAHADPAAEYPAVAITCGAELRTVGPDGARSISAEEFFVGHLTTALELGEILTEIVFPSLAGAGWSFREICRRHGDFALVGASTMLSLDVTGRCHDARIVLFGVGGVPVRMSEAEAMLEDQAPGTELFRAAARAVEAALDGAPSDVHATSEYRRHLAGVLTGRCLQEAAARAAGTL